MGGKSLCTCVGKEQVSQDGVVTLSRLAPAPHFVKSDGVTAEITSSAVQARHEVLAWSRVTLCSVPVWASP